MKKSILAAGAALMALSSIGAAFGATADAPKKSFPLISGDYILTLNRVCQPVIAVTYTQNGSNVVSRINMSSVSSSGLSAGALTATNNGGSGTFTFTSTQSQGDPVLIEDNLGGEFGTPLTASSGSDSVTFTQTATTLAIDDGSGTSTYNIYYGLVKSGIAESAVFGGLDDKGCMQTGSVSQAK